MSKLVTPATQEILDLATVLFVLDDNPELVYDSNSVVDVAWALASYLKQFDRWDDMLDYNEDLFVDTAYNMADPSFSEYLTGLADKHAQIRSPKEIRTALYESLLHYGSIRKHMIYLGSLEG